MGVFQRVRFGSATAAALLAGLGSVGAIELPNLSGTWRLNPGASDTPETAMRESDSSSRSGGGLHGHGGGSMGRHRHSGAAPDEPGRPNDDAESWRDAQRQERTLEIRHREPLLAITDASGRERVLYTDGRSIQEERSEGTTKLRARWKDGRIEVTSIPEKGPKRVVTYAVTADRTQLTVTTTITRSRGGELTIRRLYDAVPVVPEPAAPASPGGSSAVTDDEDPEITR